MFFLLLPNGTGGKRIRAWRVGSKILGLYLLLTEVLARKKESGAKWESTGCFLSLTYAGKGVERDGVTRVKGVFRVKGGGRAPPTHSHQAGPIIPS
jgi:hypothetical protein